MKDTAATLALAAFGMSLVALSHSNGVFEIFVAAFCFLALVVVLALNRWGVKK